MKKIAILLSVFMVTLISVSCNQMVKSSYSIKGEDSLYVGEISSFEVKANIGSSPSAKSINWKSNNEKVFTVTEAGQVTASGEGSASLIATFDDNGEQVTLTKAINITVLNQDKFPKEEYVIDGPDRSYKGQTGQLSLSSSDGDLSGVLSVNWSSDNEELFTVDEKTGEFSALSDEGTVFVTALLDTQDGEVVLGKEITLYDGLLVLEYDISGNPLVVLPFGAREPSSFSGELRAPIMHDFVIDWGDGEKTVVDMAGGKYQEGIFSHTYGEGFTQDTVEVAISGDLMQLITSVNQNYDIGYGAPWVDVKQWGNAAFIGSAENHLMSGPFYYYRGVDFSATDAPYLEGGLYQFFMTDHEGFNPDVGHWDMGEVTSTENMFSALLSFNRDLSDWDMSSVTNMRNMFGQAENFNGDISGWDVSNVIIMTNMFSRAFSFAGDLSSWDVSNVLTFDHMFSGNYEGTSPFMVKGVEAWNPSPYASFQNMFQARQPLDLDLSSWEFRVLESNEYPTWAFMFYKTGLDPSYHPQGCTSSCGIDHP